jgi:hypothetical protein
VFTTQSLLLNTQKIALVYQNYAIETSAIESIIYIFWELQGKNRHFFMEEKNLEINLSFTF